MECNYKFNNTVGRISDKVKILMPNLISEKENILFCAQGLYSELGVCQGDSGGPAIQQ